MKQHCTLLNVWLTWLGLPALALAVGWLRGWPGGVVVLAVGVAAELIYLRVFPSLSRYLGYGSVADEPAAAGEGTEVARQVVFYSANICPFCPIVRRRLKALRDELGFELKEIDLTFRPELARAKGIRSVPVVEAEGRFLHGNATTSQLAALITKRGWGSRPSGS